MAQIVTSGSKMVTKRLTLHLQYQIKFPISLSLLVHPVPSWHSSLGEERPELADAVSFPIVTRPSLGHELYQPDGAS